jgi:hypothetical protein
MSSSFYFSAASTNTEAESSTWVMVMVEPEKGLDASAKPLELALCGLLLKVILPAFL